MDQSACCYAWRHRKHIYLASFGFPNVHELSLLHFCFLQVLTHTLHAYFTVLPVLTKATSYLSVRLTAIRVAVNEVSSHLCKTLTLIMLKTYLQTRRRRYSIAQRPVVTCYNSAKPPETSKNFRKRPKMHSFSTGRTSRNGLYSWDNAKFSAWAPLLSFSNVF